MRLVIKNKSHLDAAAAKLLKLTIPARIYAFYGAMGSGKTTIIKAICKSLGALDLVTSPSFTLVNEYKTASGDSLYHIDFYRIKKQEEAFDLGIEEYLSSGSYCFIEWPEMAEDILPAKIVRITITVGINEERILNLL